MVTARPIARLICNNDNSVSKSEADETRSRAESPETFEIWYRVSRVLAPV